ncbi:MAG: TonB-dependent receptor [Pontibacterium sp.]
MKTSLSLAAAIAVALPAYAQETELDTVIVSATRFEQADNETPTVVNSISAEQIAASGATTIADVLRTQPGIHIRDVAGNNNRVAISMRGFGQNTVSNVLVLVNGRRLNNQTLEAANLNSLSLGDVARIEVMQGSAGTLYGDQAVGGVINIITQPITDAKGRITVSRGTDDNEQYTATYSQGFDNGFGVRLSGEAQHADNYRKSSATDFENVFLEIEKLYDTGRVFAEAQQVKDNIEFPGALSASQKAEDRTQANAFPWAVNYDTGIFLVGLEQDITTDWQLLAEYSFRDTNGELPWGAQDTRVTSFTPRLQGTLGSAQVTLGYDRHRSDFERNGVNKHQTVDALYARTTLPLSERTTLTFGGRNSKVNDVNDLNDNTSKKSGFVKEIGLSYRLNTQHRFFARRDESFRYANMDELASLPTGVDFLEPQEGTSYELGWEWQQPNRQLQLSLFRLDLKNEIKLDPNTLSPSFFPANVNLPESQRTGLVLSTAHQATQALRLFGNYSFTDSEIQAGTYKGKAVPYVPTHSATFGADYKVNNQVNLYLDAKYTGSQYQDDDEANDLPKVDAYTVVNASLGWTHQNWDASVRINNLLNKQYDAYTKADQWTPGGSAYYPAPDRQLMLTVGYSF